MERNLKQFESFDVKNETQTNYDIRVTIEDNKSLDIEGIKNYFLTFQIPDTEGNHRLIQRIFEVYRDDGALGTKWRKCELIFTVDEFILIYDAEQRL